MVDLGNLRAEFHGNLTQHVGTEVIFPLNSDEEGNLWAGPPVFSKTRAFTGTISRWKANFGFIKCEEVSDEVYIHGNAAWRGNVPAQVGQQVTFEMHINNQGKLAASSPKPVEGGIVANSAENPAKRQKLFQQPLTKGGSTWLPSLGAGPMGGGMDYGSFGAWGSWGKGGCKASGKAASGWAQNGKGSGGKAGKAGEIGLKVPSYGMIRRRDLALSKC